MSHVIHYRAGGWLPPNAALNFQRDDQGKDFVTNWRGRIVAPGDGECVGVGSDAPFPNGFGPAYALVRIDTGPFKGHVWYIGHCTAVVKPGQKFKRFATLARADQGHPSQIGISVPGDGGWVELGTQLPDGSLGPNTHGSPHWFDNLLRTEVPVRVPDPALRYGQRGPRVKALNQGLKRCGYMKRLDALLARDRFTAKTHGAVILYKQRHGIKMPPVVKDPAKQLDRGIVSDAMYDAVAACKTK